MKFLISLLIFYSISIFAERTTLPQEEKDELKYIDSIRAKGFSDRILDRLHKSIATNITRIKELADKNYLKNGYRYLQNEPIDESIVSKNQLFFTDKENKLYFKLDLGQGVTYEDYPTHHIFDTKAYVYLNEDGKSHSKIIFQFTRVNTTGRTYVKEVRRIINPSPNSPEPMKLEGEKINDVKKLQEENITDESVEPDTNNDIVIEYFSGHDKDLPKEDEKKLASEPTPSKTAKEPANATEKKPEPKDPPRDPNYKAKDLPWVNQTPDMENLASMKNRLNDPEELLSYSSQKHVIDTYRVVLKVLNREIERKVKAIELNQRIIIKKMTEINF